MRGLKQLEKQLRDVILKMDVSDKEVWNRLAAKRSEEGELTFIIEKVFMDVAFDTKTSEEVLKRFASFKDVMIKAVVACNPKTPREVLRKLALDESYSVRFRVATNPNTP
jgi:hypothetical protein